MTGDLSAAASRGASNTLVWQAARLTSQILSTIVLARLLTPADFGIVAMVIAITGVSEVLRDLGLTLAAVQARTLTNAQRSNLFWVNAGIGLVLSVLVALAAFPISALYSNQVLLGITLALAPVYFMNGLAAQFRAHMNREMRVSALNVSDVVPQVLALVAAVGIAASWHSYWALVIQQLAASLLGLVFAVFLARWWPGLPSRTASIRSLLDFGFPFVGSQSLQYVTKNVDNIAIGMVWGDVALGLYSRAYQLLLVPLNQLVAPLARVAVAALSRVQDERDRLLHYAYSAQVAVLTAVVMLYAFLAGQATAVVLILFGTEWAGMVPIFQALATAGVFLALLHPLNWLYLATATTGSQFRYALISQPLIIATIVLSVNYGTLAVASSLAIAYSLNWLAALVWCARATHLNLERLMFHGLRALFLLGAPITLVNFAVSQFVGSAWLSLVLGLSLSGLYVAIAISLVPAVRADFRTLARGVRLMRSRGIP